MKTSKIVRHGMSTVTVLIFCLMMSMMSEETLAYDDLRDKDCMASSGVSLKTRIPKEEMVWEGTIGIALDCDKSYDNPLDFNADSNTDTIHCSGANRWQPDYFPDCNSEIVPEVMSVSVQIRGEMDACVANKTKSTSPKQFSSDGMKTYFKVTRPPKFKCDTNGGDLGEVKLVVEIPIDKKDGVKFSRNNVDTFEKELPVRLGVNDSSNATNMIMKTRYDFDCPQGSVSQMTSVGPRCRGCSIGHFLNSKNRCEPCPKGHFQDHPMQSMCKMCPSLANSKKGSDVWRQVGRKTKNRLHHMMSCPVVVSNGNGSVTVRQPNDAFGDGEEMTKVHDGDELIDKVVKEVSEASVTTVTYFLVSIVAVLNVIVSR